EFGRMPQRLTIHGMQHGVASTVGGGAGALRGALAVMGGHTAERTLVDFAVLGARERQPPVLELVYRLRRIAAEIFDRVLVAEPVGALDRVVHVPAPVILAHVAEGRADPALGRNGVAAGREHLADAGGLEPLDRGSQGGAQSSAAGADDDDVIAVI